MKTVSAPASRVLLALLVPLVLASALLVTSSPAGAIVVTQGGPPATGAGSGGGGGANYTCNGGNPSPAGPNGGYDWPFPLCTYNPWNPQSVVGNLGLCPTGWDVYHFYGNSANPGAVQAWTVTRAAVHNSCDPRTAVAATVFSPTPIDSSNNAADPAIAPLLGQNGSEFTRQSGPGGDLGNPVYTTFDGNYTSGGNYFGAGANCASLQTNNTADVVAIFQGLATNPSTVAPAAAQWAHNFMLSSDPSAPGYVSWLWAAGNNAPAANMEMNLNRAASIPNVWTPDASTWAALAANYGNGVPACTSGYQFAPTATQANPTPSKAIYGTCIIPVQRAAVPWQDNQGHINPGYVANGGDRYVVGYGGDGPSVGSYDGTAHAAWRAVIAGEIGTRWFNHGADPTPVVGGPYGSNNPTIYPSGWDSFLQASTAASANAYCADGAGTVGTNTPGSPPGDTGGTIPIKVLTPTVAQNIGIGSGVLVAGGHLNPQAITVTPGTWTCQNCSQVVNAPADTATSLTVTVHIASTNGYTDFTPYASPGWTLTASAPGADNFTFSATCARVVGNNGTTDDFPAAGQCAAINHSIPITLGFLSATKASQTIVSTIVSASGTWVTYGAGCANHIGATVNGQLTSLCQHPYTSQTYGLTLGAPSVSTVYGATAVPGNIG